MANYKRDYKELYGDKIKKQDKPIIIYELNKNTYEIKKTIIDTYSVSNDYNLHYRGDERLIYQYFKDAGYKLLGRFKSDDVDKFSRNRLITFEDNDERAIEIIKGVLQAEINMLQKSIDTANRRLEKFKKNNNIGD